MQRVEIRAQGSVDQHWSERLGGLAIMHTAQDETVLTGPIVDRSASYGLMARLRDLGLPVSSLNCVEIED